MDMQKVQQRDFYLEKYSMQKKLGTDGSLLLLRTIRLTYLLWLISL